MLNDINKDNPFKIPENYFDNFHKDIMNRIKVEEKPQIIPLWKKVMPWTALAAAVCGIIFSVNIFLKSSEKSNMFISDDKEIYSNNSHVLSDEDYFLMYLEDEANYESYSDAIFNQLNQ